jgi:hypothetical protein
VSTLAERAEAAREVLRQDAGLDPHLVLALVVWPSQELRAAAPPRRQALTSGEVERMAA